MAGQPQRKALVIAGVTDIYDGLVRLVVDVQRFGFTLSALTTGAPALSGACISITLLLDHGLDCTSLQARLSRHPTIRHLQVIELDPTSCEREA
jgi:hypothetical protein